MLALFTLGFAGVATGLVLSQREDERRTEQDSIDSKRGDSRIEGFGSRISVLDGVSQVSWHPRATALAASAVGLRRERTVRVYEAPSWHLRYEVPGFLPAWSPGGSKLAFLSPAQDRVLVADAAIGEVEREFEIQTSTVGWLDEATVLAAAGNIVALDQLPPRDVVTCSGGCLVTFSPTSRLAAVADAKSAIARWRVFELSGAREIVDLGMVRPPIWSSGSPALVSQDDRGVFLVEGGITHRTDRLDSASEALGVDEAGVHVVARGAEGRTLLLWHIPSNSVREIDSSPDGLRSSARPISWSPDGRFVVSVLASFGRVPSAEIFPVLTK